MPYDISVAMPIDHIETAGAFFSQEALVKVAMAADEAGFGAASVTDHPVPSSRWLDAGGHYAQDPFVMLGMVGAVTKRIRLMTNIIVLPYRNPFVTARSISSLDCFTGGRVILGMGAGYLKAEYKALGVDFDNRNELMDEYIRAMKQAWSGEDFAFEGTGYVALGNRVLPRPAQNPHPPLVIGGNSKRALRRTAELADFWYPFIVPKIVSDTARTANISSDDDLRDAISYLHEYCDKIGRKDRPGMMMAAGFSISGDWNAQEAIDLYSHHRELGSSLSGSSIDAASVEEWVDQAHRFGEEVIARLD